MLLTAGQNVFRLSRRIEQFVAVETRKNNPVGTLIGVRIRSCVARASAVAAMQPYLNAYPLPNGSDNAATGSAQFNASFSNAASAPAFECQLSCRRILPG